MTERLFIKGTNNYNKDLEYERYDVFHFYLSAILSSCRDIIVTNRILRGNKENIIDIAVTKNIFYILK